MPNAPTIQLTFGTQHIGITFSNSDSPAKNRLRRYDVAEGASSQILIADNIPVNGVFTDYHVASGHTYIYTGEAVDSGGSYAMSATQSGSLVLADAWLHAVTIHNTATNRTGTPVKLLPQESVDFISERSSTAYHHGGNTDPVIGASSVSGENVSFLAKHLDQETRDGIQALFELKTTLCYRDPLGNMQFCSLLQRQTTDHYPLTEEPFTLLGNSFKPIASPNTFAPDESYLLLQTGFYLLTEDGGRLQLDS